MYTDGVQSDNGTMSQFQQNIFTSFIKLNSNSILPRRVKMAIMSYAAMVASNQHTRAV